MIPPAPHPKVFQVRLSQYQLSVSQGRIHNNSFILLIYGELDYFLNPFSASCLKYKSGWEALMVKVTAVGTLFLSVTIDLFPSTLDSASNLNCKVLWITCLSLQALLVELFFLSISVSQHIAPPKQPRETNFSFVEHSGVSPFHMLKICDSCHTQPILIFQVLTFQEPQIPLNPD